MKHYGNSFVGGRESAYSGKVPVWLSVDEQFPAGCTFEATDAGKTYPIGTAVYVSSMGGKATVYTDSSVLSDGQVVTGANQENAAYPSGLCAERTTLFAANANNPTTAVLALAVACYTNGHFTSDPASPCGACRQVMLETEHRFGVPMKVLLYGARECYVFESAKDLLPVCFTSESLV